MTPIGLSGNGTLGYPISQPLFNGRIGPYEFGGALFAVCCECATSVSNMNLVAYKSTDSGASWTRVDSLPNTIPNAAASVSWKGSGSVLDVGFMDDSLGNHGDLHRTTFDMNTETFGSVEDVGITIPNYSGKQFLFQKSNGDFVYTWGEFSGGIRNVKFALKTLGSWSVATDISGATPRSRLFMDTFEMSTGDVGVLWFTQTVGNTTDQLFFATISGLTVSNALVPVTATDFIDLGTPSMYLAGPDTIVYPIISKASLADNEALYLMAETVSGTPSWSTISVFSNVAVIDDFGQYPQIFEVPGGFEYYWTDLGPDFDPTDGLIFKSTASSLAGPWSAPTTYYDANASPSDPPASSNEMFPFYGHVLGDGTVGLIMGEVQHVEGPSFCGVLYYLPPSAPSACGDPIQVSPDDAQFRQSASEINPYYFEIGTQLYQVLVASQGEAKIGVFKRAKSSIEGAWAEEDSASSPDNAAQSGYLNVVKNGTKLAILYLLDDFVSLKIVEFDTATDTYGSPTSALTIPTSNGTFAFVLKGSMYVVIGSGPATLSANTYVVTNTGGTWSSITNIIAAPAITLYGALLDVFGMLRFFGNRVSQHLDMWTLDNSLALVSFIPHTFTNNLDFSKGRPSMVQISSTSYAVGFFTTLALHPFTAIVVTNTNTSPIYTPNSVYVQPSIGDPEEGSYATLALGLGGNLTAFFVRRNITSIPVIDEVDRSTISAGTWSAYATYYDAVANPPAGGASDTSQIIRALQPIQFGSGWSLALTMNTVSGEDTLQTGFYIDACGAGQTLQLTKTVIGGSAVPAMWLLTGTGPTPISGAGDTGALPVDPGTYALSESTGPDGYTPGAWDCGEAEMPTATSVVVPEGEDVVCNIDNTAGTPPFRASCPSPIYVVGTPYSSFVTVVGGVPPYTFTLLSGSLPTGLSLNATTGELSGTPSADGPFTFVIRVTDDNGDHADTSSCSAGRCPGTRSII